MDLLWAPNLTSVTIQGLFPWWRHQMETSSALLAICPGDSPVTGEFPAKTPVTRNFEVFFDLRLNELLSKHSWGWWLRRHRAHYDVTVMHNIYPWCFCSLLKLYYPFCLGWRSISFAPIFPGSFIGTGTIRVPIISFVQCGEGILEITLQWRHNEHDGVLNNQRLNCLLNRLFRRRSKKYQSSASLAFVRGIHRWPVVSPHTGLITRKCYHLVTSSCMRKM